ncbi:ribonuclease J [Acidipropionibacterium virtanenii]|uniref:Ribonuclease J n=1 Tax=Acidipropionibacterium virtanenii TaxID=2057246 RepID=A0A344UTA5_9ACTN|nr:ribonuclease J [Acidipropionibacterium virtanenii]AXE38503.1 Ribonuclease J [Acidipropionibacterium virtanenii]
MAKTGLKTPPTLKPDVLRVIPLGGLGDVGRNMSCYEINSEMLLIDCGVLFPEDDHPGVDLLLPGLDYLDDKLDQVQALVLTHGHEDHIGAVPYLLKRRADIPIYGSRLTLALLEGKLKEHRIRGYQLHVVKEGDSVEIGEQFDLEFLAVNHSIPDALAVCVRTDAGTVLNTGDFKMDQLPLDHRITDLRGFARLGEEGIDLFMVDSTNAEVPGFVRSETEIEPAIERVFEQAQKKLIVACFSSHVHRVQQVLNMAVKHHRKVCYVGRSMVRNMAVARDLGYLKVPGDTLIELRDLDKYADDQVVIVSTGSQGEPLSALARIANREHRDIEVGEGDTVLLASSLIPGNENAVYRVMNGLTRLGAKVVHKGNALVHVSGHAAAGELLYAYNIVRPRSVMPIHGEIRHLIANGGIARATGVAEDNIIVTEDGGVVDVDDGVPRIVGKVDASYIFVDGTGVGEVTEDALTDRKILGEEGFISVVVAVNSREGSIISGPSIQARGVAEGEDSYSQVRDQVVEELEKALRQGVDDPHRLQQVVRRTVGRWVSRTYRRRPMIVPVVVAV